MHSTCLTFLCMAFILLKGSVALYCVQCSSLEDPMCAAGMIPPKKCSSHTKACLTYIGKMPVPGMDVVIRDCANHDMGSFCQEVPEGPGTFQHEFCVNTCYKNRCNAEPLAVPMGEF